MKTLLICASSILLVSCLTSGDNDNTTSTTEPTTTVVPGFRLTTSFTGPSKPLGVEQDTNNTPVPILVNTSQTDSPLWNIKPIDGGLFQITPTISSPGNALTVLIDGDNSTLILSQSNNALAQQWTITPLSNGFCRITSQLLGTGISLDVVNNDDDRELKMVASGNFTGQYWQLDNIIGVSTNETLNQCSAAEQNDETTQESFLPTANYRQATLHGFSVLINPNVDSSGQTGVDALSELDDQLAAVTSYVSGDTLTQLQQVRIWMEANQLTDRSGQFHVSEVWLANNGYNPEKAGDVEISNAKIFVENAQELNVSTVLHELAHARQLYLTNNNSTLDFEGVYEQALASGAYDSVDYVTGAARPAYAMTNYKEYFAELTEAYFASNDFFPFNRAELFDFDPDGYELIRQAWEQ